MPPAIELDIEDRDALIAYLRAAGRIGADEAPEVRVLRGGVSNRTVWVGRACGAQWVIKQALRRLRVQVEWLSDPERISREALGMRRLARMLPPGTVPELIFEDRAQHLLAMSAVAEPHRNWKSILLAGEVDRDQVRQFARLLSALHAAPEGAQAEFADTSYFESLRLEPYYEYTALQTPDARGFLRKLIQETRAAKLSIVHGDFSPKNILVHEGRLILLDHEVIHFGDPAFDIGFSMTHLLSKAHHVRGQRLRLAAAASDYWIEYSRVRPWDSRFEARAVRHTLACLLARVDGRSPLEYLSPRERDAQRRAALELIPHPPATMPDLIDEFVRRLPPCP